MTQRFRLQMTPEQKAELARRACELNISESALVRRLIREAAGGKRGRTT